MEQVALVGAGLIGQAWAIVFARGGCRVALWDVDSRAAAAACGIIEQRLAEMHQVGLIESPQTLAARISLAGTLAEAVSTADYVQENALESLEVKRSLFAQLDQLTPKSAILASSSSALLASSFTESLSGRDRCLVAHPANPPSLLPLVELSPSPWTSPAVVQRAAALLSQCGMVPVRVRKEIPGFLLNRLQGALLNEAFRLVAEGHALPEDIDNVIRHGLGLRWSFMGPFETIDLNAPGGLTDYCRRYGPFYQTLRGSPPSAEAWSEELIQLLETDRRDQLPLSQHADRQAWRDRRLMHLAAHKAQVNQREGV